MSSYTCIVTELLSLTCWKGQNVVFVWLQKMSSVLGAICYHLHNTNTHAHTHTHTHAHTIFICTSEFLISVFRKVKIMFIFSRALAKLLNSRKQNLPDVSRREMLRKVKGAISASAKRFSGYGQHVSVNFVVSLL